MGKIRVMLVDDDRLAIEYMRGIVRNGRRLGYEVVAAAYNGKQGVAPSGKTRVLFRSLL